MPLKRKSEFYIYLSVFVCVVASGAYLTASFYQSNSDKSSQDSFGVVHPVGQDVRRRGENELSWNQVKAEADVFMEDRVFTGSTSSARVTLKKTRQFLIEPNSLIRITDDSDTPLFEFDNGSFMASLVKGSKIRVKNHGRISEIASNGGVIRLEARDKNVQLVVLKGSVTVEPEIGEKPVEIKENQKIEVSAQVPQVTPLSIALVSPEPGGSIDAKDSSTIHFKWKMSKVNASSVIEVSRDPMFKERVLKKELQDQTHLDTSLEAGQVYFWRVVGRDQSADVSATSSFAYVGHEVETKPVVERTAASSPPEAIQEPQALPPPEPEKKPSHQKIDTRVADRGVQKSKAVEKPQEPISMPSDPNPEFGPPKLAETPTSEAPFLRREWKVPVFSVFGGLGASYIRFEQQSSQSLENGKFAKITSPIISAGGVARITPKSQIGVEYNNIPGEFSKTTSTAIDKSKFNWTILSTEYEHIVFEESQNRIWLLGGLQIHDLPFLSENSSGTTNLIENDVKNLSAGGKLEHHLGSNYNYEGLLRYQHPLSSSSSSGLDFSLKPRVVFDGLLGVSRQFDSGMKIGLYWYGQYWHFNYSSSREGLSSSGSQSMFNSTVQIRVEFGFFDDSK